MKFKPWQILCSTLCILLLAGCSTTTQSSKDPVFKSAPLNGDKLTQGYLQEVKFAGNTFEYTKQSNVADMSRILYFPKVAELNLGKNAGQGSKKEEGNLLAIKNKSLTLFLDCNLNQQSLEARKALRQRSYKLNKNIITKLEIIKNYLLSTVIYKPDSQHPYWEITLSKGVNTSQCGYQEWQYNFDIAQNDFTTTSVSQQLKEIKQNVIEPQLKAVAKQMWDWICYE